jgi:hypothetical protein
MKLTKMIFDEWKIWVQLPPKTIEWSQQRANTEDVDGLFWYDGYWATFWYMLNLSWFEMNDKMTAATGETRTYYPPMNFCDE